MDKMIRKILVANRGEIAARVIRTAKKMGIGTVAVFSHEDKDSPHVRLADNSYFLNGNELRETYLNIPAIIDIAVTSGADAIHPGYGFLSENPLFVKACHDAGIIFIGPDAEVMHTMGNKIQARDFVSAAGVPVVKGIKGSKDDILRSADQITFPVLVKAAAGGGGKGMIIVHRKEDLEEALESASRQALAYFGDETVYLEKYLEEPRHIEIQILGDSYGNVIHLYERECSVQRRYQKIIEESPSVTLTPELRAKMGDAAVTIGKKAGYTGAGTIEFLVDKNLDFYFLEMNTRIQVEHPVTEMVTGFDIVEEQILIASGEKLRYRQEQIIQKGHAIECRIYAEDPQNNFLPSPGKITLYHLPEGPGIRTDSAVEGKALISSSFDPMIAKLITHGRNREEAVGMMISALDEFIVHGIRTNTEFLLSVMNDPLYRENRISTGYCDSHLTELVNAANKRKNEIPAVIPVAAYIVRELQPSGNSGVWSETGLWRNLLRIKFRFNENQFEIPVQKNERNILFDFENLSFIVSLKKSENGMVRFALNGEIHTARISDSASGTAVISVNGSQFNIERNLWLPDEQVQSSFADSHKGEIHSPMPGKVIRINIQEGQKVEKGAVLLIVEAMKMENIIKSPADAVVKKINVAMNERIEPERVMVELESLTN